MSRVIKCAHIQASNPKHDGTPAEIKEAMIQKHIPLIEEAGKKGVNILCLQEIFYGPYFCAEQDIKLHIEIIRLTECEQVRLHAFEFGERRSVFIHPNDPHKGANQ